MRLSALSILAIRLVVILFGCAVLLGAVVQLRTAESHHTSVPGDFGTWGAAPPPLSSGVALGLKRRPSCRLTEPTHST